MLKAADFLSQMSSEFHRDTIGSSVFQRKLTEEGRDFYVVGIKKRQDSRGNRDAHVRMNCSNADLDQCIWRRYTTHYVGLPSKADALFRQCRPAIAAKILSNVDKSSASISSPRRPKRPPGLAGQAEFVTSIADEVMRKNNDIELTSSVTQKSHSGIRNQRQAEELNGKAGMTGRKKSGFEPSGRPKWGTIERGKGETTDKGKQREEQRLMPLNETENHENVTEKSDLTDAQVEDRGQSKQEENETDEKRDEKRREEKEEKEGALTNEVSSSVHEFDDAVNDLAPEDTVSRTMIGEEQLSVIVNINQPENSGAGTMDLPVPPPQESYTDRLQEPLRETVRPNWLQRTTDEESADARWRCQEKQLQHVGPTMIGAMQTRCVHRASDSLGQHSDNSVEIITEDDRETTTETDFDKTKSVDISIGRLQTPSDSFASSRHIPRSSAVRSAEPQMSPSSSSNDYRRSKVTNELIPGQDVLVRDVIVGDAKIRLISRRNHPQPNRASILRQVAAASSSTSSFAFSSSASRSAVASPASMFHRNSPIAKNFTTALVLLQGPFAKVRRNPFTYNRKKTTCRVGNLSSRSRNSVKAALKASRTNYQATRTFLVNSTTSPEVAEVSPRRRSTSSTPQSPRMKTRPFNLAESAGKRTQKERPTGGQRQPKRTFFEKSSNSMETKSGDDAHRHLHQPQLQLRKSFTVHRTATRTLVARQEQRNR